MKKRFLRSLLYVFGVMVMVSLASCGSSGASTSSNIATGTPTHGLGFNTPTSSVPLPTATNAPSVTTTPGSVNWGVQTKTSGCIGYGSGMALADPGCTPGDIFPIATAAIVCVPGYTQTVRNVPTSEKDAVYAEYGVKIHTPGEFEVDHYVPLELAGNNDISNLWPEPALPTPGFHQKDEVENYLHGLMCAGKVSIQKVQIDIATNWLNVYASMPANCKQPYPATGCTYSASGIDAGQ